ncbi:MAG: hypothetical protein COX20_11285 [Desulfobacterales bacterium CG23_combo_of_CG06-09_8_20_14_all_52_9]|nr:MAG: hypothetical protein COX20_11285 [Desulfobacterales bacterium CG23_combo_of_CG06-09_8_20_14_all_52_9]
MQDTNILGEELIRTFYRMVHTIGIYKDNNQMVHEAVSKFMTLAGSLAKGSDLEILIWRGRLFLQGEKLSYRRETFAFISAWLDFFQERDLSGIRFLTKVANAPRGEFVLLARLLNESISQEEPAAWLEDQLFTRKIDWVEMIQEVEEPLSKEEAKTPSDADLDRDLLRKQKARQNYKRALDVVKEVSQKISAQSTVGIRKARRLAQNMVELVMEDESLMHCMASIRDYDDYTYTHSINVALLAMCVGRRIGLSHILLEQLGICGMFHDLGKLDVSTDILHKPGRLAPEEWEIMRQHPLMGVIRILRLRAPSGMKSRIALGPFEHHLKMDLTGYPKTRLTQNVTLFGRILSIVDTYDAVTSHRAYRVRSLMPNEAVCFMWNRLNRQFDPILLKVFICMMGPFPAGSVVKLNTGEMGISMGINPASKKPGQRVLLLVKDEAGGYRKGEILNLDEPEKGEKAAVKRIHSSIPPSSIGIQPAEFLMQ